MSGTTQGVLTSEKIDWKLALKILFAFLTAALIYLILLLSIFSSWPESRIAIVAIGGISIGAILGFLYSTFGDEKERFSSVAVGINGLIGGVTLADLANPDGVIRKGLIHTARACDLPESSSPLIAFVILTSAALGFGALYLTRTLVLNEALNAAMKRLDDARRDIEKNPPPINPEGKSPTSTSETRLLTEAEGAGETGSPGKLLADAMAFYQEGKYPRAIEVLNKVLDANPANTDALLYLASAQISENPGGTNEMYRAARANLEKLITLQNPPITAYKLLGYVLLYHPETEPDYQRRLEESVRYTNIYLAAFPEDRWAMVNLAAAYGQMGPQNVVAREKLPPLIRELAKYPDQRARIVDLQKDGESLHLWAADPDYLSALQTSP